MSRGMKFRSTRSRRGWLAIPIVRRAGIYAHKVGMVLGPTKNAGASGTHHLSAGVVELLCARRKAQAVERLAGPEPWPAS